MTVVATCIEIIMGRAVSNISIQDRIDRVTRLANQGLWFPHSSEKMTGVPVDPDITNVLAYISARKGISRGIIDDAYLDKLPGAIHQGTLLDRARGAMIGCAVGDALGTTLEFTQPGTFDPISDIIGGGPFNLKPGEWTDDSSMLLCLAHSLTRSRGFNLQDQIELYVKWWKEGAFSVTAECFDIGITVTTALEDYLRTGDPVSGPTDKYSAGNGSLMRLAPVPIFYHQNFKDAVAYAGQSSLSTHGALEAVDACRYFGALIWGALNGVTKAELLDGVYSAVDGYWTSTPLCESVVTIAESIGTLENSQNSIRGTGYVIDTLRAALWAFATTDNFEDGLLKVVNLGEDADTTGAIYGQLAGAYYGERQIPQRWVEKIKYNYFFYQKAGELVACSR